MKNRITFFSALCFFLSAVEMAIPKPLPFMRLGLANLPVMASLALFSVKETIILIFLKVLLQAFVSGTLFSYVFLFSLAGTVASGFGMLLIYRLLGGKRGLVSWFGVSLFGGLMNNLAQIVVAKFILFGDNISYVAPLLLSAGFLCSGILGIFMNIFWKNSRFVKIVGINGSTEKTVVSAKEENSTYFQKDKSGLEDDRKKSFCKIYTSILISILAFAGILISSSLYLIYGTFILFLILNAIKYKKIRLITPLLIIVSVTFLELLSPAGKILWQYGSFKVTDIPLVAGLLKSGKLCAMVVVSRFAVNKSIHLPGKAGEFVSEAFGIFGELYRENSSKCTDIVNIKKDRKSLLFYIDTRLCEVWENVN